MQQPATDETLDIPSCILPRDEEEELGGLYHGSYKAIANVDFLKAAGITHVVNTATYPEKGFALKCILSQLTTVMRLLLRD